MPYDVYDPFARLYNRHWGNFVRILVPALDELVLNDNPPPAQVLDLCCGTGQLAAILTNRGYAVTGVDGSAKMLDYAHQNAPQANFVHADARSFSLPPEYDIALSTFDSLNHILTLDELVQAFACVYAALKPGGVFLFDLNMETGYRLRGTGSFGKADPDLVHVAEYSMGRDFGYLRITIFDDVNGWQRTDIELKQAWYSQQEIETGLQSVGFDQIAAYDASQFPHKRIAGDNVIFVAHKS